MNFAIIGGDARSTYMARTLSAAGHRVRCHSVPYAPDYTPADALGRADAVILPIPTKALPMPLEELLPLIPPQARIFGGALTAELCSQFCQWSITDLLSVEALAVENASLTARAAALLLQSALPCSLRDTPVLVLGAGRVGTLTALELHRLGAHVTVAARNPAQRAWSRALGVGAADLTAPIACSIVVNTIPARVIDAASLPESTLLMELASAPGGFDPAQAEALGHTLLPAPGLPGQYLPESAGRTLAETVLALLK